MFLLLMKATVKAKLSQFQPYEDFHVKTFAVHWKGVLICYIDNYCN